MRTNHPHTPTFGSILAERNPELLAKLLAVRTSNKITETNASSSTGSNTISSTSGHNTTESSSEWDNERLAQSRLKEYYAVCSKEHDYLVECFPRLEDAVEYILRRQDTPFSKLVVGENKNYCIKQMKVNQSIHNLDRGKLSPKYSMYPQVCPYEEELFVKPLTSKEYVDRTPVDSLCADEFLVCCSYSSR